MTTILLVEDELLIRMALADTLVDVGYRVLEARHGAEALEILSARGHIDVLITDVRMPGDIDGIALAWAVADRVPGVAIIVASGHAQPTPGELPEGTIFFAKPFWPKALTAVVAGVLASRTSHGTAFDPVATAVAPSLAAVADEALHVVTDDHATHEREADGDTEV